MLSWAATPGSRSEARLTLAVLGLALTLALLGCDLLQWTGPPSQGPARVAQRAVQTPAAIDPSARRTTIFLPRLFEDQSLRLAPVGRVIVDGGNPARAALDALIQGPDGDERAADFQYALDRRTRTLGVTVEDGTATVDLGAGLERVHGRPYSELVYWSIVYTLTETPGVQRVALRWNGQPLATLGDPPFAVPALGARADAPDWARPR